MKKFNYIAFLFLISMFLFSCSNELEEEYLATTNPSSGSIIDTTELSLRASSSDYPDIAVNPVGKFFWWKGMDDAKHLFTLKDRTSLIGWTDKFEDWIFCTLPITSDNKPKWFEIMKEHIVVLNRYSEKSTGAHRLIPANELVNSSQYTLLENLGSIFNKQIPGTEPIYEYISDLHKDYMYVIGASQKKWMDEKEPYYRYTNKILGYASIYRNTIISRGISVFFDKSPYYPDQYLDLRITVSTSLQKKTIQMKQGLIDGLGFSTYDIGVVNGFTLEAYINGIKTKTIDFGRYNVVTFKYINKNNTISYITAYPTLTYVSTQGSSLLTDLDYMLFFKYSNTIPTSAVITYPLN